jgi:hypothetical protein
MTSLYKGNKLIIIPRKIKVSIYKRENKVHNNNNSKEQQVISDLVSKHCANNVSRVSADKVQPICPRRRSLPGTFKRLDIAQRTSCSSEHHYFVCGKSRPGYRLFWLHFYWFSLPPPDKCRDVIQLRPRPLHSTALSIHYSPVSLPLQVIKSQTPHRAVK